MNTVVCIGDSLTYGKSWLNGSDLAMTLNVRLSIKYPGISFVNLGANGEITTALDIRKAEADAYNPFRVIVWEGINDISIGVSAATIQSNLQSIYTYYKVTKGYEVWALTITPKDDNSTAQNTVRDNVNYWIKYHATSVDRAIDAFRAIVSPVDNTIRYWKYADPNTQNHMNDAGMAAIVNLFP